MTAHTAVNTGSRRGAHAHARAHLLIGQAAQLRVAIYVVGDGRVPVEHEPVNMVRKDGRIGRANRCSVADPPNRKLLRACAGAAGGSCVDGSRTRRPAISSGRNPQRARLYAPTAARSTSRSCARSTVPPKSRKDMRPRTALVPRSCSGRTRHSESVAAHNSAFNCGRKRRAHAHTRGRRSGELQALSHVAEAGMQTR